MFWYVEQLSMTTIRFNTGGPSSFHERGRDSCLRAVLCYKRLFTRVTSAFMKWAWATCGFNSTYFDQFFNFLKKIVCKTSAAGSKMVPKLILIFFAECHESYVPHRWRDFRCPAGYFWSPTAWQRSFYGSRGCSDCWEEWYVNIVSLQNVLMIFLPILVPTKHDGHVCPQPRPS